jgi:hypothetical protein
MPNSGQASQENRWVAISPRCSPARHALMISFGSCSAGVTTLSFREQTTRGANSAFPAILVRDPAYNGVPDDTF